MENETSNGESEGAEEEGGEGGGLGEERTGGCFDEGGGDGDGVGDGDARYGVRDLPEGGRGRGRNSVFRRGIGFGSSPVRASLCDRACRCN